MQEVLNSQIINCWLWSLWSDHQALWFSKTVLGGAGEVRGQIEGVRGYSQMNHIIWKTDCWVHKAIQCPISPAPDSQSGGLAMRLF